MGKEPARRSVVERPQKEPGYLATVSQATTLPATPPRRAEVWKSCRMVGEIMQSTKRGFTLIELLVVIAIIAILAAILFGVRAREGKCAQITRTSNGRQLGTALMQLSGL